MEEPNIREPVEAICRELGLEPKDVRHLVVSPDEVLAEVCLLDERGSKYVLDNGLIAVEYKRFKVAT